MSLKTASLKILNDLFGIQSRGGCSCAGPYGHRLLHIDLDHSHHFEREITRGCEGIKPGWVRVNFNYFIDDETFGYLVEAVKLVAERGRDLLSYYDFEPDSGLWRHRDGSPVAPRSLHSLRYGRCTEGGTVELQIPHVASLPLRQGLDGYLAQARSLIDDLVRDRPPPPKRAPTTDDFEHLRWFPYADL